jgi:predicted 3-demethylubiquinone-9 3-methyltransferase (glyoxalase superfamily)
MIECDTQEEIDRYWDALLKGGQPEQCGWLKDRYGLSWQISAKALGQMLSDPDRAKAKRAAEAMMEMVKIDIAALKRAYEGH